MCYEEIAEQIIENAKKDFKKHYHENRDTGLMPDMKSWDKCLEDAMHDALDEIEDGLVEALEDLDPGEKKVEAEQYGE